MFALKNLAFELRPNSTVFAFLDSYHAVIHLKDWTGNLVSLRSCSERFGRAQELQLRLGFRMLSTAFFITFGLKSFKIAGLRVRFDYVVRVIANADHSIMRAAVKPCVADCIALSRPRHQKRFQAIDAAQFA
jgi:hypothetical protein